LKVVERLERQVKLIRELAGELKVEASYRGIERLVQVTIQALLDLGLMSVAALGGRKPSRYSEVGFVLYELGIIDPSQAETFRAMAGLRNILVHMYASVDKEKVMEASRKLIRDAVEISEAILSAVKSKGVDPSGTEDLDLAEAVAKLRKVLEGRVLLAYLFGGRVKGYRLKGDYDVAVMMPENYTLYDLGFLHVEAAEALGVDEEAVDVVSLNSAPPELVLEALSGIPIVDNPEKRLELEVKALMELLDVRESLEAANRVASQQSTKTAQGLTPAR